MSQQYLVFTRDKQAVLKDCLKKLILIECEIGFTSGSGCLSFHAKQLDNFYEILLGAGYDYTNL